MTRTRELRGWPERERGLVRQLLAEGWRMQPHKGGHYRLTHPSGEWITVSRSRPGDRRAWLNLRAQVRRIEGGRSR